MLPPDSARSEVVGAREDAKQGWQFDAQKGMKIDMYCQVAVVACQV